MSLCQDCTGQVVRLSFKAKLIPGPRLFAACHTLFRKWSWRAYWLGLRKENLPENEMACNRAHTNELKLPLCGIRRYVMPQMQLELKSKNTLASEFMITLV